MNNLGFVTSTIVALALLAGCSGKANKVKKVQQGTTVNGFTVEALTVSNDGFEVALAGSHELEGTISGSAASSDFSMQTQVLTDSVEISGKGVNFSVYNEVVFANPERLGVLLGDHQLEKTPDGQDVEPVLNESTTARIRVSDVTADGNAQVFRARIDEVVQLDGTPQPESTTAGLEAYKNGLEASLMARIQQLKAERKEQSLELPASLTALPYYQEVPSFANFVDDLQAMGYEAVLKENHYALTFPGMPATSAGGITFKLSELENGQVIEGLTVSNYDYKPQDNFRFDLVGEFVTEGKLMFDEYYNDVVYSANEDSKLQSVVDLGAKQVPLMRYCDIDNMEELLAELPAEDQEKVNKPGGELPVKLVVNNFVMYGAWQSEFRISVDFVRMAE